MNILFYIFTVQLIQQLIDEMKLKEKNWFQITMWYPAWLGWHDLGKSPAYIYFNGLHVNVYKKLQNCVFIKKKVLIKVLINLIQNLFFSSLSIYGFWCKMYKRASYGFLQGSVYWCMQSGKLTELEKVLQLLHIYMKNVQINKHNKLQRYQSEITTSLPRTKHLWQINNNIFS